MGTLPRTLIKREIVSEDLGGHYKKLEGHTIRCHSLDHDAEGYKVACRFYRGEVGEENTFHWFAPNGDYISTLDGG